MLKSSLSSFEKELILLIKSYCPIIYIQSYEEERLENSLRQIVNNNLKSSFYSWDFIQGYTNNPNDLGFAATNPSQALDMVEQVINDNAAIVVLKDFYLFLKDLGVQRKLRNLSHLLRNQSQTIIITASEISIPISLQEIMTVVTFPLPGELEIKQELHQLFRLTKTNEDPVLVNKLTRACKGLSIDRIRKVFSQVFILNSKITEDAIRLILDEKKKIISQTQILEFYPSKESINDIGGLSTLKEWLIIRSNAFSDKAKRYGLPSPRGLLLVGIQGTGKSLTAKVIANEWALPLMRLDVGKIFGGIVGESESRMRQMIQLAEAMSPCVLWIDELDKVFSGTDSKGDSGTTGRVLATFITWLSEKKSTVFIVATANDIRSLPIEILRKGRLDEIFFLGLPSQVERELIFQVHLERIRPKSWFMYDIELLSNLTENFSGAEIEQVITEAMHIGFSQKREFVTQDITEAISSFVPLADTYKEQIQILQEWLVSGRIRSASGE